MTQSEVKNQVIEILDNHSLWFNGEKICGLHKLHALDAIEIEDQIEEIIFQNEVGEDCVFQIIDDKLVIQVL